MGRQQQNNRTLEDQLNRTRQQDASMQDKMENTSAELVDVKKAMKDMERKAQVHCMTKYSV